MTCNRISLSSRHRVRNAGDVALIGRAVECYGRVDAMVNNAGIPGPGSIEEIDAEAFDDALAVLFRSVFLD